MIINFRFFVAGEVYTGYHLNMSTAQQKARIMQRLALACDRYREDGKEENEKACYFVTGWGRLLGRIVLIEEKESGKRQKA